MHGMPSARPLRALHTCGSPDLLGRESGWRLQLLAPKEYSDVIAIMGTGSGGGEECPKLTCRVGPVGFGGSGRTYGARIRALASRPAGKDSWPSGGCMCPPGRRDHLHIRPRFFRVAGVTFEISTSPLLCNQCHNVKPCCRARKAWSARRRSLPACYYPSGFRDTAWVKYRALAQVAMWGTPAFAEIGASSVRSTACGRIGPCALART